MPSPLTSPSSATVESDPVPFVNAEGGTRARRQRAAADAAREDAEADDRRDESEQVSGPSSALLALRRLRSSARGRHGLGFTFTRLPLTMWYLGFGFLSGQSGSFFLLAFLTAGLARLGFVA